MFAEYKTVSAVGGTKRRKYVTTTSSNATSALSHRVTRLAKSMRANHPSHLFQLACNTAFPSMSTTGTIYDLAQGIAQGDDYNQRNSSSCILSHLNVKGVIIPGTTAATVTSIRITVFKAQSGIAFASNMLGSYSPIVTGTSIRVMYDKFFSVGPQFAAAGPGWQTNVNISLKLRHQQKFSGVGAGTQTGDSVYIIAQGGTASGTLAPTWISGVVEIFFKPT